MSKKPPKRPEHCPQGYEWLPDAYKRDVEPHGPEVRERVRQAFAEGDIIALLRTRSGERHEIAPRMWDKEPIAEKVYPRFDDGWMRMGLGLTTGLYTGRYVEGFVFVPQEKLTEAALAMMGPGKSKDEEWEAEQHGTQVKDRPDHRPLTARDRQTQRKLRNAVLKAKKMCQNNSALSDERIAELLAGQPGIGYRQETLRKIVRGTYSPLKRLGIPR